MEKEKRKIWFTSDTHFFHRNILKFQKSRPEALGVRFSDENADELQNEALIDIWNRYISKDDDVYFLGDFSFGGEDETREVLERLNGHKHLIWGNHDRALNNLTDYFESSCQIQNLWFEKGDYDFLDENLHIVLCHFPMLVWNKKTYGSIMLHGHTHGSIDSINRNSADLRADVGLDSEFTGFRPVSLQEVYEYMKKKAKGYANFRDYAKSKMNEGVMSY